MLGSQSALRTCSVHPEAECEPRGLGPTKVLGVVGLRWWRLRPTPVVPGRPKALPVTPERSRIQIKKEPSAQKLHPYFRPSLALGRPSGVVEHSSPFFPPDAQPPRALS